ncbi:MAG: GNAT family N-acetyltransferase [Pseudonocardiaceae bacterium]
MVVQHRGELWRAGDCSTLSPGAVLELTLIAMPAAVRPGVADGAELGSALLDWAARRTRQAGKSWLRLDAWKSNPALHQYYLDRGFTLVRIDDNPADPSGVCFQRPAASFLVVERVARTRARDATDPSEVPGRHPIETVPGMTFRSAGNRGHQVLDKTTADRRSPGGAVMATAR